MCDYMRLYANVCVYVYTYIDKLNVCLCDYNIN